MSLQYLSDKEALSSQAHTSPVVSVCWLPSSSIVLSGDCHGNLKAWDAGSARSYKSLPQAHETALHCISTNHDASLVLTSAIDGSIALWDLTSFQHTTAPEIADATEATQDPPLLPLPVEDDAMLIRVQLDSLVAAPSGSTKVSEAWKTILHPSLPIFASVGAGARLTLHSTGEGDASFGTLVAATAALPSAARKDLFGVSLAIDSTGSLLAVGASTGEVFLYTCHKSSGYVLELVGEYADHPSPARALGFSPGHLYVGGDDRILTIHDIRSLQEHACAVATSDETSAARLDGPQMGGTVAALTGHTGWILATAPVPSSSRLVASISMDRTIRFWDLAVNPKSCICTCSEVDTIHAFSFQPAAPTPPDAAVTAPTSVGGFGTSSRFVTASNDGKLRWYRSAGI